MSQRAFNVVFGGLFVVLALGTVYQFWADNRDATRQAQAADERGDALEEQLTAAQVDRQTLAGQVNELQGQVRSLGERPVVPERDVPDVTDASLDARIAAQVVRYFDAYPIRLPQVSQAALQAAVTSYFVDNPPPAGARGERGDDGADGAAGEPGRTPTDSEIAGFVADYLRANPPASGAAGRDGVSYVAVELVGCDLVFTASDGSRDRVGPVCGPRGEKGERGADGQTGPAGPAGVVQVVVAAECSSGEGYLATVGQAYDSATQTITVTCTRSTAGLLPIQPSSP